MYNCTEYKKDNFFFFWTNKRALNYYGPIDDIDDNFSIIRSNTHQTGVHRGRDRGVLRMRLRGIAKASQTSSLYTKLLLLRGHDGPPCDGATCGALNFLHPRVITRRSSLLPPYCGDDTRGRPFLFYSIIKYIYYILLNKK